MKKIAFLFLFFGSATLASAQKKLSVYKTFGGVVYVLNDSLDLTTKQAATFIYPHRQAYAEFNSARKWATISAVTGFTGAAMVAIPLATLVFGGNSDWGYGIGGSALLAFGIISNHVYKSHAVHAINLYNTDFPQKTSRIKPQLQFYGTQMGLVVKF